MNHGTEGHPTAPGKVGAVLIMGAGIGGMQAALDLADAGFKVYLVDKTAAIGGHMAQLDKTFPTNDCAMCTISPKLVECDKHLNIEIITQAQVEKVTGEAGNFQVTLRQDPLYVDPIQCNACGDCVAVCPITLPDEFNESVDGRKAIYKQYPQAIPNHYAISKGHRAPCRLACPAGTNAQAYVALIAQGKFAEALEVIEERLPFPGVLGRVCHHPCEAQCNRREIDEAVSVCALKRFVADYMAEQSEGRNREGRGEWKMENGKWKMENGARSPVQFPTSNFPFPHPRVAIVGAGPAGLTAAADLARWGYPVTVFEASPEPGGMMRWGIPAYRLPREVLNREIQAVLDLGVELKTNTPIGPELTLKDLQGRGYQAIFLAVGAQKNAQLGIPGEEDYEGVIDCLEFLRQANSGDRTKPGEKVLVIGGGNSAIDSARTALRLGCQEVTVVYRRTRQEMPAIPTEIMEAEEEGIQFHYLAAPVRILGENGKVTGMECQRMELGEPDESGRRRPVPIAGSEFVLEADTIIPAIGQVGDLPFLQDHPQIEVTRRGAIVVDPVTLATGEPGIFAGGDAVSGAASVVEAIGQGHEAAISIDRYLSGVDLRAGREEPQPEPAGVPPRKFERQPRQEMAHLSLEQRRTTFHELGWGLTQEQAIAEARRCLACGLCSECLQCVKVCAAGAINHDAKERFFDLQVGAIILAPGYELVAPELRAEYGYGRYPNVLTSLEFERILSASGPFQGQILRLSDGRHPKRIAWIQCVGSRDSSCGRDYCSSVCCMYATKQAMVAKEHEADIEATIFYNDLRAFGKGFERYYERAKNEHGVRYVKSMVSTVKELQQSNNLVLRYALDNGEIQEEEFDLVVLSVGLNPTAAARPLAEKTGIALNRFGFAQTSKFHPNETSRPGIFTCGTFEAPMDIPEAVMTASSAAALAGSLLAEARGTLVSEKVYPPERDVSQEEPRVGVFVCHCGSNIARVVEVEDVVEYARTLPHVVHAEHNLYTCSSDAQREIIETIKEKGLNRVVVSSCTPRTHEPLFQDMLREAGLNRYLFEMANIRDQCSWVHAEVPEQATEKAKDLMRMAVARAITLEPIQDMSYEVCQKGLVVGGGLAGMTAALTLAEQGFETFLIEREPVLGGRLRYLHYTLEGEDPHEHFRQLLERIESEPRLIVYTQAEIIDFSGHVGDFKTRIRTPQGEVDLEHGVIIVATGGVEYQPEEYLYGQDPRVLTQVELEEKIYEWEAGKLGGGETGKPGHGETASEFPNAPISEFPKQVVMIQCVGSRDEEHPYCSRVCCASAVKNARRLKQLNPDTNVYVLYRDMRTYAFKELAYRQAREAGVVFIRYEPERKPEVRANNGPLEVSVVDPVLGRRVQFRPDYLVLSSAIRPHPTHPDLARRFKVSLDNDGFFLEAHLKLRPLDFANEGMFLCGLAHSPKFAEEAIAQARGAAARAATVLSREFLTVSGMVAQVDEEKCAACLTCVRVCPFHVPIIYDHAAHIDPALCQGCGTCAAACPAKAIQVSHYQDHQILAKCASLFREYSPFAAALPKPELVEA